MRDEMAMTKNVLKALSAVNELRDQTRSVEKLGVIYGRTGEGKTTVLAYAANQVDGKCVRALEAWTPKEMMAALLFELDVKSPTGTVNQMKLEVVRRIAEHGTPLFVDEADKLLARVGLLEHLRDIYDLSGCPVILIGEDELKVRLEDYAKGRISRRITEWVEFRGIDDEDARILADGLLEVDLADDLLEHVREKSLGIVGFMVASFKRIEAFARGNSLPLVTLAQWGERPLAEPPKALRDEHRRSGRGR